MGKRKAKIRKPKSKRPSKQESDLQSQHAHGPTSQTSEDASKNHTIKTKTIDENSGTDKDVSTGVDDASASTPFGFDDVCGECQKLYESKMSKVLIDTPDIPGTGIHLGKILNVTSDSPCRMCRDFFRLRWSTSGGNNYHLYAFSASRVLYGRSVQYLKGDNDASPVDNVVFAVLADYQDPPSQALNNPQQREKMVLISTKASESGA